MDTVGQIHAEWDMNVFGNSWWNNSTNVNRMVTLMKKTEYHNIHSFCEEHEGLSKKKGMAIHSILIIQDHNELKNISNHEATPLAWLAEKKRKEMSL